MKIRIKPWEKYGYNLTAKQLHRAILAAIPRYKRVMRRDSELVTLRPPTNNR